MNYQEELRERIQMAIAEAMVIQDPEKFVANLSARLSELVMDEISFKLRR